MPCLELPYHPEIPSLTLLAIMLNVLLPAHYHNTMSQYSGSTNTQLTQLYKQSSSCFWLAFLLIWVIRLSSFDTCLMDKGYFHWIFRKSEEVGIHVTLWLLADIIAMTGMVAIEQVGAWVCAVQCIAPSHLQNVTIRFDIRIVRQQEVVTYVPPVQAFVSGVKILTGSKLSLIAWLFPSEGLDLQGFKGQRYGILKWARLCHMEE